MIDLMKVTGTDGKEYRVPVAAVDAIVARNRRHTDAAPGEAELGRELIAWASDEDAAMRYDENGVHHCLLCGTALVYNNDRHADTCMHLRARAARQ